MGEIGPWERGAPPPPVGVLHGVASARSIDPGEKSGELRFSPAEVGMELGG
ncbi:MAG: hypothetical protein WHU94_15905 [Thermogemmata sp.]